MSFLKITLVNSFLLEEIRWNEIAKTNREIEMKELHRILNKIR